MKEHEFVFGAVIDLTPDREFGIIKTQKKASLRLTDKRMTAGEQREYGFKNLEPTVWAHLFRRERVYPFLILKNFYGGFL